MFSQAVSVQQLISAKTDSISHLLYNDIYLEYYCFLSLSVYFSPDNLEKNTFK